MLLRTSLSRHADVPATAWAFEADGHGKPRIVRPNGSGLDFSVSHTHGLVACAVALGTPVGVDVERLQRVVSVPDIAGRCFRPEERQQLDDAGAAATRRFFEIWTLKESFTKALGLGLAADLLSFSFDVTGESVRVCFHGHDDDPALWHFRVASPTPDHVIAISVRCAAPVTITLHDAGCREAPGLARSRGASC